MPECLYRASKKSGFPLKTCGNDSVNHSLYYRDDNNQLSRFSLFAPRLYPSLSRFRYSEGVCPVCFLKIILNDDLELNPASRAMDKIFRCCFWGSAKSFLTASTRYWLIKSKKFWFNWVLMTSERLCGVIDSFSANWFRVKSLSM